MRLDPAYVRLQLDALRRNHPELLDDEEALELSIESETEAKEFLSRVVRAIQERQILCCGVNSYIGQLKEREDRYERAIDALRGLCRTVMDTAGLPKLELPSATLSLRKGQQKVIGNPDPGTLPNEFVRVKLEPNLTAIKEALQAGQDVPGCTLSNAEPSLAIRIR